MTMSPSVVLITATSFAFIGLVSDGLAAAVADSCLASSARAHNRPASKVKRDKEKRNFISRQNVPRSGADVTMKGARFEPGHGKTSKILDAHRTRLCAGGRLLPWASLGPNDFACNQTWS